MPPTEPFLPPLEPTDNPKPAGKVPGKWKPVLLWLILIVMFVSIYQLSAKPTSVSPVDEGAVEVCVSGWWQWAANWLLAPLGAVGGPLIAWLVWSTRGSYRYGVLREPGILAMAEGQFKAAATTFRGLAGAYRRANRLWSVAQLDLVQALYWGGQPSAALAEAMVVERGVGLLWAGDMRVHAAIFLVELHAASGELDVAERWAVEVRKRLRKNSGRTQLASLLCVAESLIACRQERYEDALAALERDWHQLEFNLTVVKMRTAWLLRAYAQSQHAGPREAGASALWLEMLRREHRGAFDHLAAAWPEMRAFLLAHDLAAIGEARG